MGKAHAKLGVVCLMTAALTLVPGRAEALPVVVGDITLDGKVNVSDVQCYVLAAANPGSPPACMKATAAEADISCDGNLNVSDLQMAVLLAVGNPLPEALDPDGDHRVAQCDPDRDGDGWSDLCEAASVTDAGDPLSSPADDSLCPDSPLTTACRISGVAGDDVRCDLLIARRVGTESPTKVRVVFQVDTDRLNLSRIDTLRSCDGEVCTYGGSVPPATSTISGAPIDAFPVCDEAPCSEDWSPGGPSITIGPSSTGLTEAVWSPPSVPESAFFVSLGGTLTEDVEGLLVEVVEVQAEHDGEPHDALLLSAEGQATIVTDGPATTGAEQCDDDVDCDDADPCTTDTCIDGSCDHIPSDGACDTGDLCFIAGQCINGSCVGEPLDCDDGLSCTADSCFGGLCVSETESGFCVHQGVCLPSSSELCSPTLMLTEIGPDLFPDGDDLIEISHAGLESVSLQGVLLTTLGAGLVLPPVTLGPAEKLIVRTGFGPPSATTFYANGALGDLIPDGGEVTLRRNGVIMDYVAWGSPPHPSMTEALEAGAWQGEHALVIDALTTSDTMQSSGPPGPGGWNGAQSTSGSDPVVCDGSNCIEIACHDGQDGDGDGDTDCEDSDCESANCQAITPEVCDDQVDNDGDGFTDCLDPDCLALSDCQPSTRLNELAFVGDGVVELFNGGPGPATLNHYALCLDALCANITSTDILLPGAHAVVYFNGGDGFEGVDLSGALGSLTPEGGELLLRLAVGSPSGAPLSYVAWGDGPRPLENEAIGDDLWESEARIFADGVADGDSIAFRDTAEDNATWDVHITPSVGLGNPSCGLEGQCREHRCDDEVDGDGDGLIDCDDGDCGAYDACNPRLVINEVAIDGPDGDDVEIANLGEDAASLLRVTLTSGDTALHFDEPLQLGPGEVLVIREGGDDLEDDSGSPVIQHGFGLTLTGGELWLSGPGGLDYVRWGDGVSALEPQAVAEGQWTTNSAVNTDGYVIGQSALTYDGLGDDASDWGVRDGSIGLNNPVEFGNCGDNLDNDNDGLIDCLDDDCAGALGCEGEICGNGLDDDDDGLADCDDTDDCSGYIGCTEVALCGDGIDNDGDGLTDCLDLDDCAADPVCIEGANCADGIDNDNDGLTDCEDLEECAESVGCIEVGACDDGIDNDGDGLTDCEQQVACGAETYCQEGANCSDGVDNDHDGLTDCEDEENCEGELGCIEVDCGDAIDDDGDGLIDCDDPECAERPVCVGADGELVFSELYLDNLNEQDAIEVQNIGPASIDVALFWICTTSGCYSPAEETILGPGAYLVIETGDGFDFEGYLFAGDALSGLSSEGGYVGLYTQEEPDSAEQVVDWVQWGTTNNTGEDLAAEAGVWQEGEAIPSAAYKSGLTSLSWLGTGRGASHWAISYQPSIGDTNPGCSEIGSCAELNCGDFIDNDGDTYTDCEDADCSVTDSCKDESLHCDDNLDNDADGLLDCEDNEDCEDAPACDESIRCDDLVDNDSDGDTDCEDVECTGHPACSESVNCADQTDNDVDGLYDCDDPDCVLSDACRETDSECDDLYDNDLDGLADCLDIDCASSTACLETGRCWDGLDNDLDGLTDCEDTACAQTEPCKPRLQLTEIGFGVNGTDAVELGNTGQTPLSASGAWVCIDDTCVTIHSDMAALEGQGTLQVRAEGGEDIAGSLFAGAGAFELDPSQGSARLYGATASDGSPTLLLDFVQWGDVGQSGEEEAIAAGRWQTNTAVPNGNLSGGLSLGRYGVSYDARNWTVRSTPSLAGGFEPCIDINCVETWCDDGRDDDRVGGIDCEDNACASDPACEEALRCGDGLDNDLDGITDCYDSACATDVACVDALRIVEVTLSAAPSVEIFNPTETSVAPAGFMLCDQSGTCADLSPMGTIDGGTVGTVDLSALAPALSLDVEGGSLTLTDGGAPETAQSILSFVGWGAHASQLHDAAVDGKRWRQGDTIPTHGMNPATDSLANDGTGSLLDAWSIRTGPTMGAVHEGCTLPGECREWRCGDGADNDSDQQVDCGDPDCSAAPDCTGRVVISEVYPAEGSLRDDWVELANLSETSVSITGWRLCGSDGSSCYTFGEGELEAGMHITVTLAVDPLDAPGIFVSDALGDLAAHAGRLSLHTAGDLSSPENLVDFVAWGQGPHEGLTLAVDAGQWSATVGLDTSVWAQNVDLLSYRGEGDGPQAWTVVTVPTPAQVNLLCDLAGVCREMSCGDGLDGDADFLTDCADPDCAIHPQCQEAEACTDGVDNDGDQSTDCQDPDCFGNPACSEAAQCADNIDNDLDGRVDCEDISCMGKAHCQEVLGCDDGVDNDLDGLTDCRDDACAGEALCPESANCDDSVDNDLDGLVDCADDDCVSASACLEGANCGDEVDNDLNGLTDCSDEACASFEACTGGIPCVSDDTLSCGQTKSHDLDDGVMFNADGACGSQNNGLAVTFEFVAGCDGVVEVSLDADPNDIMVITRLEGICSSRAWCAESFQEPMSFTATAGVTYFLVVNRIDNQSTGNGAFDITATCLPCSEEICDDGEDEDGDTLTDCDDPDCADATVCAEVFACDNGVDDDGDGLTDCADSQCLTSDSCDESLACQDGVDQDLDGLTDCDDPDCPHFLAGDTDGFCEASESPDAPFTSSGLCGDGEDNDSDGLPDCADPDCAGTAECNEVGACSTGVDEDNDGSTDCSDTDCDAVLPCLNAQVCERHGDIGCGQQVTLNPQVAGSDALSGPYCGLSGAPTGSFEVIHRVSAPCDGALRADIQGQGQGAFSLAIFEGQCRDVAHCGVDAARWSVVSEDGNVASVEWLSNKGVEYFLVVESLDATADDFTLSLHCVGCPESGCGDGVDDDGDGLIDCDDDDCATISPCATEGSCDDGFDGDFDGKIDCDDVDCSGVGSCHYPCNPKPLSCGTIEMFDLASSPGTTDTMTTYGCSEDDYAGKEESYRLQIISGCEPTITVERATGTGSIDLLHLDTDAPACSPESCESVALMGEDGTASMTASDVIAGQSLLLTVDGRDGFEGSYRLAVSCCDNPIEGLCSDGIDDDADGLTDCVDEDCATFPACIPEKNCGNGADDDGDGQIDCEDSDCEKSPACYDLVCDDAVDSDADGLTDCDDPDCAGTLPCVPQCENFQPIACGSVVGNQSTALGSNNFDAYGCDPANACGGAGYPGPEQIYVLTSDCDGEATITAGYGGGFPTYFIIPMGSGCEEGATSCDDTCSVPSGGATGSPSSFAEVTMPVEAAKAYWFSVESSSDPEGVGTQFDMVVNCTCL